MSTPLNGLQITIVSKRQNGVSVSFLAKEYDVSRQAIYNLLKKAEKEGSKIPWKTHKKVKNTCVICKKEDFFKTKTCSLECRQILRVQINVKKDAKWSKHSFLNLICISCGKKFKRTNYQQSISINKPTKKNIKENYCSIECYYNRNVVLSKSIYRKVSDE